jgi:hypothetical protein
MRRARTFRVLLTAASVISCGVAHADDPPKVETRRVEIPASLLKRLDSPGVQDRIDATEELRELSQMRLEVIDAVLASPGLSLEAVERVSGVGYQSFARSPRAAMGVSFGGLQMPGEGVSISGTVAGFDSSRVLQAGDIIRSIDGAPIREQLDARRTIISYDPGQTVTVEVLRAGEVREFRLRLGSFDNLQAPGRGVDSATKRLAWESRVRRLRGGRIEPALDSGLGADRVMQLRSREFARRERGVLVLEDQPGGVKGLDDRDLGPGNGPLLVVGGADRRQTHEITRLFSLDPMKLLGQSELVNLTEQGDQIAWQARNQRALLRDVGLKPGERDRNLLMLRQNDLSALRASEQRLEVSRKIRQIKREEFIPQ